MYPFAVPPHLRQNGLPVRSRHCVRSGNNGNRAFSTDALPQFSVMRRVCNSLLFFPSVQMKMQSAAAETARQVGRWQWSDQQLTQEEKKESKERMTTALWGTDAIQTVGTGNLCCFTTTSCCYGNKLHLSVIQCSLRVEELTGKVGRDCWRRKGKQRMTDNRWTCDWVRSALCHLRDQSTHTLPKKPLYQSACVCSVF